MIVSASSPVLAGQVKRSGGGLEYTGFDEFVEASAKVDSEMGRRGREFVRDNYSWEEVIKQWKTILEDVSSTKTVTPSFD